MTLRTQLAYAAAGLTLVLGLLGLLNPFLTTSLLGLEIVAPRGVSEVRSMFGALHLTMAGLMLWAVPLRPRTAPLLRTMGILWLGAAAGRAASLAIDGLAGPGPLLLFVLQAFVGAALVWASLESETARVEARLRREAARDDRRAASGAARRGASDDVRRPPSGGS
jgi:hypothetical protein